MYNNSFVTIEGIIARQNQLGGEHEISIQVALSRVVILDQNARDAQAGYRMLGRYGVQIAGTGLILEIDQVTHNRIEGLMAVSSGPCNT